MAYKSEIEFKVRVLDSELRELENKLNQIRNPFDPSGRSRKAETASLRAKKAELELVGRALRDLDEEQDRLFETKARKTKETNLRRLRFIREEKLKTAKLEEKARSDAEKKVREERLRTEREASRLERKAAKDAADIRKKGAARRADAVTNAVIGGAFPLLFGQGLGAATGGALGGGIGGALGGQAGFAGSLVGTALGQAVDTLISKTIELGDAFRDLGSIFDTLKNSSLISSKAEEKRIESLKKLGLDVEANVAALRDFSSVFGAGAIENLTGFSEEFEKLGSAFTRLTTDLGIFIAGPLTKLLEAINRPIEEGLLQRRIRVAKSAVVEEARAQKEQELGRKLTLKEQQQLNADVLSDFNKKSKKAFDEIVNTAKGLKNVTSDDRLDFLRKQLSFLPQPKAPNLTPQQQAERDIQSNQLVLNIAQAEQSVIQLSEKFTKAQEQRNRQQKAFDQQRANAVESAEQALGRIRESVENRIQALRLQNIARQNQILDEQAQNRIREAKQLLAIQRSDRRTSQVQEGLDPEVARVQNLVASSFEDVRQADLEAAEKAAKIKRDAAFEVLNIELQNERFKLDTAKAVSDLQLRTAKAIAAINQNVLEANRESTIEKFNAEKNIAVIQANIIVAQLELNKALLKDQINLDIELRAAITNAINKANKLADQLNSVTAPPSLTGAAPVSIPQVSTSGVDVLIQQQVDAVAKRVRVQLEGIGLEAKDAFNQAIGNVVSELDNVEQKSTDLLSSLRAEVEANARVEELIEQGLTRQLAERTQAIEVQRELERAVLNTLATELRIELANLSKAKQTEQVKERTKRINELLERTLILLQGLDPEYKKILETLKMTEDMTTDLDKIFKSIGDTIENGIVNAISSGIDALVEGTKTLDEALKEIASGVLKDIGRQLISFGVGNALGALGETGGFLGKLFGRSGGGPVRPNGTYLVGEQGPEILRLGSQGGFVYGNKSEAMDRYRPGSTPSAASQTVNVNYNVTEVNGMRYVTEEQFRAGLDQAAKRGANMGKSMTISTLKNSRSQRSKIGL